MSYQRYIMRRVTLALALALLAFFVLRAYNAYNAEIGLTAAVQQSTLAQIQLRLKADTEHIASELTRLARSPVLLGNNAQQVAGMLDNFIAQHPDDYVALRYYDPRGALLAEVINLNNAAVVIQAGELAQRPSALLDPVFVSSVTATRPQFFSTSFRLQTDLQGQPLPVPQPVFYLYLPVFNERISSQPIGIVQAEISAHYISNILLQAASNLPQSRANVPMRALLLSHSGQVVMDTQAASTLYLQNLADGGQNLASDPFYSDLADFAAERQSSFAAQLWGGQLAAGDTVSFSQPEGLVWRVLLVEDASNLLLATLSGIAGVFLLGVFVTTLVWLGIGRLLGPQLAAMDTAAALIRQMGRGRMPAADSIDEHDEITRSITQVARRIEQLNEALRGESSRYRRDLQVAARIGREITTLYDVNALLPRAINLICNELGFYHAQVFLVDDVGSHAVLVHSRGEAGQKLLQMVHKIPVGSDTVIGRVTGQGQAYFVNDTGEGARGHGFNPLLPETRAEIGLPLMIGERVIGALDIQSKEADAFREEDLPVYQLIADQFAIAIENARLLRQSEERVRQIDTLNRELTRQAWEELQEQFGLEHSYSYDLLEIVPGQPEPAPGGLSTPIVVRGEVIGTLNARLPDGAEFATGDQMVLRAVAERVALAMENRRLFFDAETERRNLGEILSAMPVGVIVLDPRSFHPLQHNERAVELLRRSIAPDAPFTPQTYKLYRSGTDLLYPAEELPMYIAAQTGESVYSDDVTMMVDGDQTDLLINAAPIRGGRGEVRAVVVVLQDISTLRSLENTLQENLRETVALYEAQRSLTEVETLDEVLDVVIMQLMLLEPSDAYVVTALHEDDPYTVARQIIAPFQPQQALDLLLEGTEMLRIGDMEQHKTLPEELRAACVKSGVRSLLAAPLRTRTRTRPLGWLIIVSDTPRAQTIDQERVLSTLSDMASTALDNRYLLQSIQTSFQETSALYNATSTISRARDLEELSQALGESLGGLAADMLGAFARGPLDQPVALMDQGLAAAGLDIAVLLNANLPEEGLFIRDVNSGRATPLLKALRQVQGLVSFGIMPLRVQDAPTGRLVVAYREPHIFTTGETRLISSVADSASVVIDNQQLFEQIQSTLQETSVLYQASRALTQASSPQEIVDVVVNYLIEPHVGHVFMALLKGRSWDAPGASVEIVANWHEEGAVDLTGVSLTAEEFPAWNRLAAASVSSVHDIYDEGLALDIMERTGIESLDARSLVIIPLRVTQRAIGAIWLGSRQPYQYNDRDMRVFQAFSEQASLSMEASFLLQQTERRARQLMTSATVSESASKILDLDILLPQLVDLIKAQFGYDHVQIFLMDATDTHAELRASTGEAGRQLLSIRHRLAKGSDSVIGQVTARGEAAVALDTADATVIHRPNPYLPLTRSELALPFIIKGQVVGALDVQSNQPNAFSEEDVQALTTLAAQISVALENARLYESAQRRASDMTFLFDITTSAAQADTLEASLQNIADRLYETLGPQNVAIYLVQLYSDQDENTFTMLRPVVLAGSGRPLDDLSPVRLDDGNSVIGIAGSTMQPIIVREVATEVRYEPVDTESHSALLVPIISGSTLVGLIALESWRPNAFGHDLLQLMLTLAGSVAAVVQSQQLLDQLQRTNEQLREVDRLKSEFLASMSHELRTPLNSIIGFSRVMLKGIDGPLTEMQQQDLSTIYNSGQHLLTLINDILDQAKIAANKMDLKLAYFDVKPMLESVKSIGIGLVKEKPIDLVVEIAPGLPRAYGDEFRTRQILLNLVNNASKFTPQGSITIRAYIDVLNDHQLIRVDVIDTGIGIDEADMPLLFEAFRQVDSSLTRTQGGTGLGLPIAKSLAEMQGGALLVFSEVNVGSTFSVFIPVEPAENTGDETPKDKTEPRLVDILPDAAAGPNKNDTAPKLPVMRKRLVLLIEDNKDRVDQFRRTLQRAGLEVQTADHPAYAEAMASNLQPNVIVMDVNFGDGEGWHILERLQGREDTADIPVVVVTLSSEEEQVYKLGAYHFAQHPIMPDDLAQVVLDAEKESNRERILIIDDDPESVRMLEALLNSSGRYRVFAATDAAEGISLVARRRPNLIILDLRMPGKDGFAVLEELRANPETSAIPVLVVTGDADLDSSELERLAAVPVLEKAAISEDGQDHLLIDSVQKNLTRMNGK